MSGAPLFVHRRHKDGPPIKRNHAEALLYDLRNQGRNSSSSAIVAKAGPRDRSKMRESEREALGYNRYGQRTFEPHWPYYWNCVYPGYQNAYYPETMRCKYAKMPVTLDLWKVMVPGQMVKTDHLTNIRWFYPYDNWLRYY